MPACRTDPSQSKAARREPHLLAEGQHHGPKRRDVGLEAAARNGHQVPRQVHAHLAASHESFQVRLLGKQARKFSSVNVRRPGGMRDAMIAPAGMQAARRTRLHYQLNSNELDGY